MAFETQHGETRARRPRGTGRKRNDRRAARLAAVQALYQIDVTGASSERVLDEFIGHRLTEQDPRAARGGADRALFADLVLGAATRRADLDTMIAPVLAEGWSLGRLDAVLRAILRAGAYELVARPAVPPKVIINEYVEVAHAFYDGREPAFVNGVLDRLARRTRPREMEASPRETAPDAR